METKEILKNLVRYNTIRDEENKELMNYVEEYLKQYNFTVQRVKKCLIAYNDENPPVGFLGHTDTVDYESWDGSPFEMQEIDGNLIGLGACDMKGGVASILSVVSKIDLNKNKIALYLTNDEEIGFGGIQDIKNFITPNNIIVGEPTNNVPVYGTKGVLELELFFYGTKCHSSTPDYGKSAIYECVDFINRIRKYYDENLKKQGNMNFEIPYTTMNIGMIQGGETVNSVPGKCMITMDFRIANVNQADTILIDIKKMLEDYNYELIVKNNVCPKLNENNIEFLEKISSKKRTKCYITEGSFIDKNFIILGPGPDTSHQKNEFISLDSLEKTVDLYIHIIEYYNEENEHENC